MPPPPPRHAHTIDPVYADPVLRASSPSDSINTEYVPDETSLEHLACSDAEFARFVEDGLDLSRTTWADAGPAKPILLPKAKDPRDEQIMFDRVMRNLREKVKELEDEELFERIRHPGNAPGPSLYAAIPSSGDISAIMRGFMPSSSSSQAANARGQGPAAGSTSGGIFGTAVTTMATTATSTTAGMAATTMVNGKGKGSANAIANQDQAQNQNQNQNQNHNLRSRTRTRAGAAVNGLSPNGVPTATNGMGMGRRQGLGLRPGLGTGVGVGEVSMGTGGRF